jgi:hypothetical protein
METSNDVYYIYYGKEVCPGIFEHGKFLTDEDSAISTVDSLISNGEHKVVIFNHRTTPRNINIEGCPWEIVQNSPDKGVYAYRMEVLR